jgi:hypothetical protein
MMTNKIINLITDWFSRFERILHSSFGSNWSGWEGWERSVGIELHGTALFTQSK